MHLSLFKGRNDGTDELGVEIHSSGNDFPRNHLGPNPSGQTKGGANQ